MGSGDETGGLTVLSSEFMKDIKMYRPFLHLFVFFFSIVFKLSENDDEVHEVDKYVSTGILVNAPCITNMLTEAGFQSGTRALFHMEDARLIEGGSDIHFCNTTQPRLISSRKSSAGVLIPKALITETGASESSGVACSRRTGLGTGILICHQVQMWVHKYPLSTRLHELDLINLDDAWLNVFVLGTKLSPGFKIISHLLSGTDINIKHTLRLDLKEQRAQIESLFRIIKLGHRKRVRCLINSIINWQNSQANAEFMKSTLETGNYDELLRLLKKNLDSINIAIETEIVTESDQISPRDQMELIAKATQLQQQGVQQQIEKIERLQQIMEEEGAPILRRTKHEIDRDEKQEETHLLLMLLVLWFLLCYCSEGTVWCVDVDLTFGLSLALSDIVLLLGGDIEKNPGPLTGTWACTMMIGSSSIIVVCFLSRRRVGKSRLKVFV